MPETCMVGENCFLDVVLPHMHTLCHREGGLGLEMAYKLRWLFFQCTHIRSGACNIIWGLER